MTTEQTIPTKEKYFESALFITPPKSEYANESSPSTMDNDEKDLERLIDKDLLYEINKCSVTKRLPFKDVTSFALNTMFFTPQIQDYAKVESPKKGFAFPDGGWVCSICQNYNFYGRMRCNRCNKDKCQGDFEGKPLHLQRFDEQNSAEANLKKKKKMLAERVGDWVCAFCKNLNFSFRKQCNRCLKLKEEACAIVQKADY